MNLAPRNPEPKKNEGTLKRSREKMEVGGSKQDKEKEHKREKGTEEQKKK